MRIVDNRALLLKVRNPQQIVTAIPKSKHVGGNQVLVNWGVEETQLLKNLKVKKVPSPIYGNYSWPGIHKPYDHQKSTAAFLTLYRRAFCFSEMGTGKTGAALWAADFLMEQGFVHRVLIICPLSIMSSAWLDELFKVVMHRTATVVHGSKEKRKKLLALNTEFVIINFDGVEVVRDQIDAGGFDLIIADEASAYKNTATKRWKTLKKLVKPETWLWMMTGTPAAQSPLDAFGLAKLVNPRGVPSFKSAFQDMVLMKVSQFKWIPRHNANQIVFESLQPAIRFTKDECMDLPEMSYAKRKVELTKQQGKYYELLRKNMRTTAAGESVTAANAAVAMNKLLQISCGAVYSDSGETVEFDIKNRYAVLKEAIEESSQKVLVFIPFRHVIDILSERLTRDGITTEIIRGSVTANKRTAIFKQFQNEHDPRVLLIQPQAAAHGVTLTAANTVVWWGPVPSLETYHQANARVHRTGQHHPCTVIQLHGSAVETRVYNLLDGRIDVHSKLVDLYNEIVET